MVNNCPAGLKPPAGARNKRKAAVKKKRKKGFWVYPTRSKKRQVICLFVGTLSEKFARIFALDPTHNQ